MEIKLAQTMAVNLMRQHGLHATWSFGFDRSISRLGYCNYTKRHISLGLHATSVNSEDEVRDTCLHEIAHALVGGGYGHGPVWKEKARSIGCNAERLGNIEVKAPARYEIICNSCSKVYNYYRRPKWLHRINEVWCTPCGKSSKGKLALKVGQDVGIAFVNKTTLDKVTLVYQTPASKYLWTDGQYEKTLAKDKAVAP